MVKKLGKFWWVGFTLSALASASAFVTHLALEPIDTGKPQQESELFKFGSYKAWWPNKSFDETHDCAIYESCVFLVIEETQRCAKDLNIRFVATDEDDLFLGEYTRVVSRLEFQNKLPIEVGSDDPRVSYFEITSISCGEALENSIREV